MATATIHYWKRSEDSETRLASIPQVGIDKPHVLQEPPQHDGDLGAGGLFRRHEVAITHI